jgi:hypothetical protein
VVASLIQHVIGPLSACSLLSSIGQPHRVTQTTVRTNIASDTGIVEQQVHLCISKMGSVEPETCIMGSIKACIFDVDGLLINSEDIYTEAMNNVLRAHGVLQELPWHIKARQQSRGRKVGLPS